MSLMQVLLGIGGASLVALSTWRQRFGSAINCCRYITAGVALVLSLLIFNVEMPGMWNVEWTIVVTLNGTIGY